MKKLGFHNVNILEKFLTDAQTKNILQKKMILLVPFVNFNDLRGHTSHSFPFFVRYRRTYILNKIALQTVKVNLCLKGGSGGILLCLLNNICMYTVQYILCS